jgi:hypothetical protein
MMPMMAEGAPEFTARFPEAAAIFDNLHMLHDNIDDVLSRPDLYPTLDARREAILRILSIYLHRNHAPEERYAEYHEKPTAGGQAGHAMMGHGQGMASMGPRPPSAKEVLAATGANVSTHEPSSTGPHPAQGHGTHPGH